MSELPPDPLPLQNDFGRDEPGPYSASRLRTVTGQRINPHSQWLYNHRDLCFGPGTPVNAAHKSLELYLADVGGFDPYMMIKQPPPEEWPLPSIIPRVAPSGTFPQWDLPKGAYAVDYARINSSLTQMPNVAWAKDLKSRFPEGSFTILDFIGKHEHVTALWTQGPEFWQHEFMTQFDAVIIPEFSAFLDDPRPQYLIGERQKQIFAQEGYEAGKIVIPSIAWSSEASLRRQVDLLGALYPNVHTVFLDMLGAKVEKVNWTWSRLLMLEKHIAHLPFRFILAGATSGWAVAELHKIFPNGNFHLMHFAPYLETTMKAGTPQDRARVFRDKVRHYEEWVRGDNLPKRMARPDISPAIRDDHE